MHRLPYLLSNLILLLSGLMTAAQASGDLNGRILDEANEPVPNANVLLYAGTEYISGVAAVWRRTIRVCRSKRSQAHPSACAELLNFATKRR